MDELVDIVTTDGNRYVVRQNTHKQDSGQYVNPVDGHMRANETLEDALRREVEEEIGWTDFAFAQIGSVVYDREEPHLFGSPHHFVEQTFADFFAKNLLLFVLVLSRGRAAAFEGRHSGSPVVLN